MIMIKDYKKAQLEENYKQSNSDMTFAEYVQCESENDPHFFRFLFDEAFDSDFDLSISDEQKAEFNDFLDSLRN